MALAPFPWFGGKSRIAGKAWEILGDCRNYVEPFFGSGAVFLARPRPFEGPETLNDKDGFIANFWRSLQKDPEAVAFHADYPTNESDIHARHSWLVRNIEPLVPKLEGDPEFYDPKVAGWWVYGISSWIGSGFASGAGPWRVTDEGELRRLGRQLPHLSSNQGINRQLPRMSANQGINRKIPHLSSEQGINRKLPAYPDKGINRKLPAYPDKGITGWFQELSQRFVDAKVCCGDWTRVLGPSVTTKHSGITGVFLDPPYQDGQEYRVGDTSIMEKVVQWCIENQADPKLRIILCGYEGLELPGWPVIEWKASGGYGNQGAGKGRENAHRERIWTNVGLGSGVCQAIS